MPKLDYMPSTDDGKAQTFALFRDNIGAQLAVLGIAATDPDIVQQAADANRFRAVVDFSAQMQNAAQSWTTEKNYERDGGDNAPAGQTVPVLPPNFPAAVPAGIVPRFRALAKRIKANNNYTPAIGLTLGIEGTQPVAPDLTTVQPDIDAELNGGQVIVHWGWGGNTAYLDMIELQVDRGDGKGYSLLAFDTTPNYTDTASLPATPTKWKYKAIYRVADQRVGLWSKEIALTVGG